MLFEHRANGERAFPGHCYAALLKWQHLSDREYTAFLSLREGRKLEGIKNTKRSRQWLAGRLAAKYLVLGLLDGIFDVKRDLGFPILHELGARDLQSFSPWMYRKIEVLPDYSKQSGYLQTIWCGEKSPVKASISHVTGMTSVCVSFGTAISMDLEVVVPRVDSFYRCNFSQKERVWVGKHSRKHSISPEWLYAFLWTLKEARLKAYNSTDLSLWNLPGIEIRALTGSSSLGEACDNMRLGRRFQSFDVNFNDQEGNMWAQVWLTATQTFILSIIMN